MPRAASAIQAELDTWYAARLAVATGQSYSIAGRSLSRANLADINATIDALEIELASASNGGPFRRGRVTGFGYRVR